MYLSLKLFRFVMYSCFAFKVTFKTHCYILTLSNNLLSVINYNNPSEHCIVNIILCQCHVFYRDSQRGQSWVWAHRAVGRSVTFRVQLQKVPSRTWHTRSARLVPAVLFARREIALSLLSGCESGSTFSERPELSLSLSLCSAPWRSLSRLLLMLIGYILLKTLSYLSALICPRAFRVGAIRWLDEYVFIFVTLSGPMQVFLFTHQLHSFFHWRKILPNNIVIASLAFYLQ